MGSYVHCCPPHGGGNHTCGTGVDEVWRCFDAYSADHASSENFMGNRAQRLEIDACYGSDWADTIHCYPGIRHNADFGATRIGDNSSDTGIHGGFWLPDAA